MDQSRSPLPSLNKLWYSYVHCIVQALYLMTTAFGNLIALVIIEIFSLAGWDQWIEFFTYAALMTIVSLAIMAVAIR